MIAAVVFGLGEKDGLHPGRNMYPVLGRPLMVYPLLAARHAKTVDRVAISTNSPSMAQVAQNQGAEVILRPSELTSRDINMGTVFRHAVEELERRTGKPVEILVILLANAPAMTAELIDRSVNFLLDHPEYSSVATVSAHNEHNPSHACFITKSQELVSFLSPPLFRASSVWSRDALGDIYFINNCLRVIRRESLFSTEGSSRLPYPWMGERTAPIVHQGGFDVDYDWQIPGIERWLRQQGFTRDKIPFVEKVAPAKPVPAAQKRTDTGTGRVLVTTVPFGEIDPQPIQLLEKAKISFDINPIGRRLREEELVEMIGDYEVLIAGTEPISEKALERAKHLKLIARVGIGLDNVPLAAARERGIAVTYTPDAPSAAVAELAVGQMLALLRNTAAADRGMRQGVWHRWIGRRLSTLTLGVIGVGRVGRLVIQHLQNWRPDKILANDLNVDDQFARLTGCVWTDKETILREADIITLHVPMSPQTRNLIAKKELEMMKPNAILINTSRGGIVDEGDLSDALRSRPNFSAAVDVYTQEPYSGELTGLQNCLLSCHMGSGTHDCRLRMEMEATQEVIRYFRGEPFASPVPEAEYQVQGGR
jgi:D-3-phosphoglycerate dehydrogenase / 2-oxoglutarate reductase